jgi:(p)ppGpp synthase/HD superfamily hydrolase
MHDVDELYEKVGLGERLAPLVARRLLPNKASEESFSGAPAPLAIAGTEGLLGAYARLLLPDSRRPESSRSCPPAGAWSCIARTCVNVEDYRKHPENWLPGRLAGHHRQVFSSEIRVDVANKMGVLAAVAAAISSGDNQHRTRGRRRERTRTAPRWSSNCAYAIGNISRAS